MRPTDQHSTRHEKLDAPLGPGWRIPDSPSLPIRERVSRITSPHRRGPRAAASQNQIQKRIHVSVCQTRGFCVPVPNPEHVGPHGDAVSVSRGTDQRDWRAVIDTGLRISVGHLCGIMRITAVRGCAIPASVPFPSESVHFWLGSKNAQKKITAVKKWPDALLRSTDGDLRSPFSNSLTLRHEKFRPFRSEEHPGGHFFKAERSFCQSLEASIKGCVR
jgi:hypothetical protein